LQQASLDISCFNSVESLLIFVFHQLETPVLSIDKIVEFLSQSDLTLESSKFVSVATIPCRLVLISLSNSEQFVRAGPPIHKCSPSLPISPFSQCDTAVAASIEQLLTKNVPMSLDQFHASADFPITARNGFERVLSVHSVEFTTLPDGRIWFVNARPPVCAGFDSVQFAIEFDRGIENVILSSDH
jgi:hypothetical protein